MSRGQRFVFLGIAVVIAVIAVVVLADSSEDDPAPTAGTATPTPTASAAPQEAAPQEESTPTPTPTPPPPPLLTAGKVRELEFKQGDTVRFRARSDAADHIHVHGYDLMKDVEPGKTATMSFKATITGIFEIEFEDSGTQIAELKVEPK
jgi:heme/copper-type cytochrome/quinol oxidase subunit 2